MTINEYQKAALRTKNPKLGRMDTLEDGLMGLSGESGEAIDLLKKHKFQGHELDVKHIVFDLETVLQMNVDKLKRRYPDGFEVSRSTNRSVGDI